MIFSKNNYFFLLIIFWKIIALIYTYVIFTSFTSLGDATTLLNLHALAFSTGIRTEGEWLPAINILTNRQLFVKFIYYIPQFVNISSHIYLFIFPLLYISLFYILFKPIYSHINKLIFWILMFSPSTLVWSTAMSKEIIFILLYFILINLFLIYFFKNRLHLIPIIVLLLFLLWVRPPYTISYIFLFLGIFFYKFYLQPKSFYRLNFLLFSMMIVFIIIITFIIIFFNLNLFISYVESYMYTIKRLFINPLSYSTSIRYDVKFEKIEHIYSNILWGVPSAFLGPTIGEIAKSPFKLVFFIDSALSIFIYFILIQKIILLNNSGITKFILYIFIPCSILIILCHYPFGIFNSGTALRWKQSLIPLVLYFPLMFMAYHHKYVKK